MHSKLKSVKILDFDAKFYGLSDNDDYFKYHIRDDSEIEFIHISTSLIRPGDIVLDIGANIGLKTFLLSKLVGETGKVIAVEPGPDIVNLLRLNVDENKLNNVTIINAACSYSSGNIIFLQNSAIGTIDVYQKDNSTLEFSNRPNDIAKDEKMWRGEYASRDRQILIKSITIDDILLEYNLQRLDFIKIDTEGHDMFILQGAERCLSSFNPFVYLECHLAYMQINANIPPKDFLDFIFSKFSKIYYTNQFLEGISNPIDSTNRYSVLLDVPLKYGACADLLCTNREFNADDIIRQNKEYEIKRNKDKDKNNNNFKIFNPIYYLIKKILPKKWRRKIRYFIGIKFGFHE